MSTGSEAELRQAVARDPTDVGARLVWADHLQAAGDPRGELIALQHERLEAGGTSRLEAAARAESAHLQRHRERFLPGVDLSTATLAWELGYVRDAFFAPTATTADVATFLRCESAAFLTTLGLERLDDPGAVLRVLVDAQRTVPRLYVRGYDLEPFPLNVPGLERLWVRGTSAALGELPPTVRRLRIDVSGPGLETVPLEQPELTALHLDLHHGPHQAAERLLSRGTLPKLEHLGVEKTGTGSDALLRAIVDAPWFGRLKTLNLCHGGLTSDSVERLAKSARGSRLRIVLLEDNDIAQSVGTMNELGIDVFYGVQEKESGRQSLGWAQPVRNRDLYSDPDGFHVSTIAIQDRISAAGREHGPEAALAVFDSVPLISPYRHGGEGQMLAVKMLKILAKGDHYESILRVCRETPPAARSTMLLGYEVLALLLTDRPAQAVVRAAEAREDDSLRTFHDWGRASLGDEAALRKLERRTHRKGNRWDRFALAALEHRRGSTGTARRLLEQAYEDVMPVTPPLPTDSVVERLFAAQS